MERPPYQERVIQEKAELDDKIAKLTAFIESANFKKVDPREQNRLRIQKHWMALYSQVLGERIEAFDS